MYSVVCVRAKSDIQPLPPPPALPLPITIPLPIPSSTHLSPPASIPPAPPPLYLSSIIFFVRVIDYEIEMLDQFSADVSDQTNLDRLAKADAWIRLYNGG